MNIPHYSESALGEDVHFDEADGFNRVHVEMGSGIAFGRNESGSDFVHGLAGENQAAGMHFGIAREAIEEMSHLQCRRVGLFGEGQIAAFEGAGDRFGELARAGKMGEALGEPADLEFGNAEDFGNFGKGAAGLEGGEPADHGGLFRAISFEDKIDDVVFAVVGEIDIDVGQFVERHALSIKEAAEVEVEADRADVTDFEAITGKRIGGAAAGDPVDAPAAAFLEDVPHDEEIFFVTDLSDDGQLLFQLRSETGMVFRVAALEPFHDQAAEVGGGRGAIRGGVRRELGFAQGEIEGAAVSDFEAVSKQFRMGREKPLHFGGWTEVVLAVEALFGMGLAEQGQGADALDDIVLPAVGREGVVGRERSDGGKTWSVERGAWSVGENGLVDWWINGLVGRGVMEWWSDGVAVFVVGVEAVDFEVKTVGEERGQSRGGAEGQKAVGLCKGNSKWQMANGRWVIRRCKVSGRP